MMRRSLFFVLLAVMLVGAASLAGASSFTVYYDPMGLSSSAGPETLDATVTGAGATGLSLSRGPAIKAAGLGNGFSADGWDNAGATRASAIQAGAYFQFGFKVDAGNKASLSSLDLSVRRSAASSPMNLELQVSLDGFATPGLTVTSFNYYGRTSGSAPAVDPTVTDPYYYMYSDLAGRANSTTSEGDAIPTIDLSKIADLQNIPAGTIVTFRLYAWGNGNTTNTNTLALGRVVGPRIQGVMSK